MTGLVSRVVLATYVLLVMVPALDAADPSFTRALNIDDVDFTQSALTVKGERTPLDAESFRKYFQSTPGKPGKSETRTAREWELLLVLRKPTPLGTAFFGAGGSEQRNFTLQVLSDAFQGNVTAALPTDWQTISPTQGFPADFRLRAFRAAARQNHRSPLAWIALTDRLASVTPLAIGSGEQVPFGSHPDSIPRGRSWVNTGKDPRPNAPKQLQRGPVSEALPSWYILSWETPQPVAGLYLSCNADKFRLLAYRGEASVNPAVAPADSWRAIEFTTLHELSEGDDRPIDRLLTFAPQKFTAFKVEMTSCFKGAEAVVAQMAALVDAKNVASFPTATDTAAGSKVVNYDQPFDGQLAMVITDMAGRTVRNLVAQVDRPQGPNSESWDLKDDFGLAVSPGAYRWKAITSPPLGVRYQMTVYPNAPQFFPGHAPWLTGESGANGWLADHAPITSGATCGDHVYFGAPGVEGGVCLIECDLTGRKLWGKHNFGPFSGVGMLAGDDRYLYIQERDSLHRLDPQTHKIDRLAALSTTERQGKITALAAHGGKVVVAMSSPVPWLENATRANVVDLENCLPRFADKIADPLGTRRVTPSPRTDFLRLLRLTGTPAGQTMPRGKTREMHFPITIDTASGDGKSQYVMVAFREPTPLGSVVLPGLGPEYLVEMSVLKPNASYPPDATRDSDWQPCPEQPKVGWTCIPAPPNTRTRGLRFKVRLAKDAGDSNLVDDLLTSNQPKKPANDLDLVLDSPGLKPSLDAGPASDWFASFEGMKLLRRRFTNRTPLAKVRVSSGKVNALGEWDAERTAALSAEDPGVYVLEWQQPQKLAGLAIKEIDGAVTEVDVWEGDAGEAPLADSPSWKNVATYKQARRDSYQPAFERNDCARYIDGYVPFGGEITTKAVRLRVVSQWADNNHTPGSNRGTASGRHDRGGQELDPRRCRVWGVAALEYLGEEAPLDTLAFQRLDIRDGQTGDVVRELPVQGSHPPVSLAFRNDGALFAVQQGRVVQLDTATGAAKQVLSEIDGQSVSASQIAIGPGGEFFVYVKPEQVVRVYDPSGKRLRTIGHAGGQQPGLWDPEKFNQVARLVVDRTGQLWVVERQDVPRRIVQYAADGRFVREFYGNAHYGGGGVLDPADPTRLFYHHVEFAIDWQTGTSRIKRLLAGGLSENCVPIRLNGQTYFATAPLSHQATQPVVIVYRYDESPGLVSLAAAFGEANHFESLKTPRILALLDGGKVPKDYTFLWSDLNGNGQVEADEVQFELKPSGSNPERIGRLNDKLRAWAGDHVFQPGKILPSGVPVFEKVASPARQGVYELAGGDLVALSVPSEVRERHGDGNGHANESRGIGPDGQVRWRYPTEHPGVSGLWLPPYEPGYVSNEFGIIGHATAKAGELGEYFVMHANNGQWKVWTADGLLAGQILRHKFDPRSIVDSSFKEASRGMALDNLTAGQEHFHGYFAQTADGKCYIVHGGNYIMVSEVLGLDRFRRMAGEITVTADDARRVRNRQEELARREAKSQARLIECVLVKTGEVPDVAELDGVKFGIGYDEKYLYARWDVSNQGQLANSGADFQRYFKTGACLDLQLGLDSQANPNRRTPLAGDLRLLFTVAGGKPQAVLYQPVAAQVSPSEAWETRTDAAGTTRFDRVVRLAEAVLKHSTNPKSPNQYRFEVAIPLASLGWKPQPGELLRADWGLLTSDDGHTVKRRLYWSNTLATGTTDEAWEARLDPHLWGNLLVTAVSRDERALEQASPSGKPKTSTAADLLDELDLNRKK